jgi:S1-C subfamily serine protease
MEDLGCPRRRRLAVILGWMLLASLQYCAAEPSVAVSPRWQVDFPAAANGRPSGSTLVPILGDSLLVGVVMPGADASRPSARAGNRAIPVQLIGYDPVSRLGFLKVTGAAIQPRTLEWLDEAASSTGTTLQAMSGGGMIQCRSNGWVKQVGGKILPLALLRVNFDRAVPPPGTALLDQGGRVAAILFQESGTGGNTGYAIPAEAVHRVRRDVGNGGPLVRGWLGLALRADTPSPQIVRILPNSPAAAAGIKPTDVLLSVGPRQISDYADAANAFFYLIPGQPVRVKLLRGVDPLEFTLTPKRPVE